MPYKDKETRNAYARKYHAEHRDSIIFSMKERYLKERETRLEKSKQYAENHKEEKHSREKKWRDKVKLDVLSHYSQGKLKCNNCGIGDIDVLCLDHINNNGVDHRKQAGIVGGKIYRWLIKNNYPKGFQVLCFNCNMKKSFNGVLAPYAQWVRLSDDQTLPNQYGKVAYERLKAVLIDHKIDIALLDSVVGEAQLDMVDARQQGCLTEVSVLSGLK